MANHLWTGMVRKPSLLKSAESLLAGPAGGDRVSAAVMLWRSEAVRQVAPTTLAFSSVVKKWCGRPIRWKGKTQQPFVSLHFYTWCVFPFDHVCVKSTSRYQATRNNTACASMAEKSTNKKARSSQPAASQVCGRIFCFQIYFRGPTYVLSACLNNIQ